jgi:hypothetical protein
MPIKNLSNPSSIFLNQRMTSTGLPFGRLKKSISVKCAGMVGHLAFIQQ